MRIAALADLHGNIRATRRVVEHIIDWNPDEVLVIGDLINRGPCSLDCLELVRELERDRGWRVIRGNHEEYVLDCAEPDYEIGSERWRVFRGAHHVFESLSAEQRQWIEALPETGRIADPTGDEIVFAHGSMLGPSEGIFPWTRRDDLEPRVDPSSRLFLCAHTHLPLRLTYGDTQIVNVGSVGLPFDGDRRATYFQLSFDGDRWHASEVRLKYDYAAAELDFRDTGYLDHGGPLATLILDELRSAESRLFTFMERYFGPIVDGEIDVDAAVEAFRKR